MNTFIARYSGRCASDMCDRPIKPGDAVVRVDEELRHDECALDSFVAPTSRAICPECFTERAASGACSCEIL